MIRFTFSLLIAGMLIFFSGCVKDSVKRTYTLLQPVYKEKAVVLNEVGSQPAQTLKNPGKIYVYGNYLFVNEINKGVHIIDNTNPANPVNRRFINIPGNVDIAVKGNTLYADLYTDMLAIDISDPTNVNVAEVVANVFPERQYGNGFIPEPGKFIVDWIEKDTTVDFNGDGGWRSCINCGVWLDAMSFSSAEPQAYAAAISKITTGIGGSMARFSVVEDYMYAVNISSLIVFDISTQQHPERVNQVPMGWNIETIYPFQGNLFIGSSTGMFIYNISNPVAPSYVSAVSHITMCDPVISDGKYAYVTLRAGAQCGNITGSQLQVLDIANLSAPVLINTYNLENPFGLGKTGDLLWICDGTDGLKVFDAKDPKALFFKYHIKTLEPYDVIPVNNNLIVSAKEGIVQFDASNPDRLTELSRIKKQ